MFNKSTPKQKLGKTIDSFETIIGTTVRIDGNLSISHSVRIDGVVNGNIFQDEGSQAAIAIAKGAEVHGDIRADHIVISGKVVGNIFTKEMVELLGTAEIVGDITYSAIGIEVGARVTGKLNQMNESELAEFSSQSLIAQAKQKATS